jgi:glycosyltransferase involved in cell wall biosynthesis
VIIVSDLPPLTEFVADGVNGVVCPALDTKALADALIDLYRRKDYAQELGLMAIKKIDSRFNWK